MKCNQGVGTPVTDVTVKPLDVLNTGCTVKPPDLLNTGCTVKPPERCRARLTPGNAVTEVTVNPL